MSALTAAPRAVTTPAKRMAALARAELTLLGRSKGTLFAALFVPVVMPFSLHQVADGMDLKGTGLSVGSVVVPGAIGFSLLFAVYSALTTVYAARREELVLKRLRTGELRDPEILAGAALPSVAIGVVQAVVLSIGCVVLLDAGAPSAPHLAVIGVLLGLVMFSALGAVTASFSRSVESAQVMAMPLAFGSMFGSGLFIPFEVMPDKLASVCELLPLSPVIELVRGGWTGNLSASEVLGATTLAVAWTVVSVFAVRRWFRWEPRR
ncbi:ABC transporter permease [Streptomyces sp. NPDC057302]|uniref:ABC transporter permease n=1 Tax=Streptomyces sp. NPDC057302 TaxID=3346094 RepID=UPI00363E6DB2